MEEFPLDPKDVPYTRNPGWAERNWRALASPLMDANVAVGQLRLRQYCTMQETLEQLGLPSASALCKQLGVDAKQKKRS